MAAPPALSRMCPICDQPLDSDAKQCPNCGAGDDWVELAEGYAFVQRRFQDWHDAGRITTVQWGRLQDHYQKGREHIHAAVRQGQPVLTGVGLPPRNQCWSCREYADPGEPRCPECGVILQSPGVRSLRYWKLLQREVQQHQEAGRLSLVQAHEFDAEVRERMAALRGRLELDRVRPTAGARPPKVALPRRSLMEILLDPRSTQWLLASGGALLVLGLIIWLTSLGVFKNPEVVAGAMGLGNGVLLAGGFALIRFTRYQVAGRALTLLACLIMPLNLWFYHAHELVTLEGNLWVAGLVCCVIYAAAAMVLRDEMFVYVLCGGIALTGLLLLANLGRFEEILAPSALLVILGLLALHLERAFPEIDSPFSRQRFGMAFYWSAQALLGSGLLLLLGAQLFGWLPFWREMRIARPAVVDHANLPWTILLSLAGTYAFVWSDLVVRRIGVYLYLAAFALLWTEVQVLALLKVSDSEPIVLMSLALTALAVNVMHATIGKDLSATRAVPPLGLSLSLVPVVFGVLLHFRATNPILRQAWPFTIDAFYIAAMVVTALSCRTGAYLYRRTMPAISFAYFFATAAATLVVAAGAAWVLNLVPGESYVPWAKQAPLVMLVPLAYLIAARLYRGHSPEQPLIWVAHASTVLMLVCSLFGALRHTPGMIRAIEGDPVNLLYALFCAEAALFYGLAASFHKQGWNVYLATLLGCGALWQLLIYWNTPHEYYTLIFAATGIVMLVAYRMSMLEYATNWSGLATAAFQSANGLLSLGFLSGVLVTLSRLAMSEAQLAQLAGGADLWRQPVRMMIFILILLGILGLVACLLVQHSGWRRFYLVVAIGNALLVVACFHKMSLLSPWQKLEIFSAIIGLVLLVIGHVGWYRENERENDLVSFCLLVGSLLTTMALIIAVIVHRFSLGEVSALDELGLIVIGVGLLGTGIVCRLKTTTLVGGIALGAYLLIVIIGLHRFLDQSVIVGIYLTAGGGLLFATGLVLSVYRDRLLALPEKIKRREGIFKVLSWR
ncbi:MAG: hypothetical protein L0Y71_19020 [Gemmataceae bacterium]|nr:hypothetical protein [Gemmataceae bacterium]